MKKWIGERMIGLGVVLLLVGRPVMVLLHYTTVQSSAVQSGVERRNETNGKIMLGRKGGVW